MNPQARKTLVGLFCEVNRLDASCVAPMTEVLIANVDAPFRLFVESVSRSPLAESSDPVDGLLMSLVRRLHDTVSGALVLLAFGRVQQAEILSRTIMESALTSQYILAENSGHRLVQYFLHYVQEEREQSRKWQNEIKSARGPWRDDHQRRINDKAAAIDGYEAFIREFEATLPLTSGQAKAWPSTYDICVDLGKAIDYRTVYAAMCSQAHHDAEDVLNDFMVGSSTNADIRGRELDCETRNFAIFLLLCSLRYYLECVELIGGRYGFRSVETQSSKSHAVVVDLAEKVSAHGFVNQEFQGFVP